MDATFAALTLGNIADGVLEAQFQDALTEVSAVLEDPEGYVRGKGDSVRCSISLEIELERHGDDNMVRVDVRARVKKPGRKRIGRHVFFSAGSGFSTPLLQQGALFDQTPPRRPIALHGSEE